MSVRQPPFDVWYFRVSSTAQWLFPAFVNDHALVATIVPLCVYSVSFPAVWVRHPVTRSCSSRLAPNDDATADRLPRAIMRVTRADVVTRPSKPTVRTMIATITSTMVKPRSLFLISAHHLA